MSVLKLYINIVINIAKIANYIIKYGTAMRLSATAVNNSAMFYTK